MEFNTALLHQQFDSDTQNGATIPPIYQVSAFAQSSAEQLEKVFNNKAHIGLSSVIKIAAALRVSPSELFPYDQNKRKTNGQRFDEITKGMDLASINYLLDVCAGYSKLNRNNRKL